MVEYSQSHPFVDENHTHEIGQRNRIENRTSLVWRLPPGVGTEPWHDHFRNLICIQRHTERLDTRLKDWQVSDETAYYLCDLRPSAARFNRTTRAHWGVENQKHHVRDTRFQENASRIRRNPCIFALLRSFTLNITRFNGVKDIKPGPLRQCAEPRPGADI